ncbi:hypothetical protein BR93DRAFT_941607 [Coniochaeta sp. PMI_546]|nr:hypothetical protein BR93DRAFT_941607 [Coniochaeta sp. PMI_546]
MTAEQAIKMGWSFVNRCLEDSAEEEENPTLQEFISLLRAIDNEKAAKERQHDEDLLMATIASLTECIASMKDEVSDMRSVVVTVATMEQKQAVLDGRIIDMQSDIVKFTTMIQRQLNDKFSEIQTQLGEAKTTSVSSGINLGELQDQVATVASFEKACSSIEVIVTKAEERLSRRMESVTLKTAHLVNQLAAVENVSKKLSEMEKQLAAVGSVGNELAGCISNELRVVQTRVEKLPKMASHLETVKFCVQLIAQRLSVPEVQVALANRSPQVQQAGGPVPLIHQAPANPASRTPVRPQAPAAEPRTPLPQVWSAQVKQSKSLSGKHKTPKGTGMPSSGSMDQYILRQSK